MKKTKINLILFLSVLLVTSSVLVVSINAATVGDTTVGVNEGDTLTWKVTEANETGTLFNLKVGDKAEVKIAEINSTSGYLYVFITTRTYNATTGNWTNISPVSPYLVYNATNNDLFYTTYGFSPAILFTPVNLTTYAAYINGTGSANAVIVGPDGVNVTYTGMGAPPGTFYCIINEKGITSSITHYVSGEVLYKMVLEGGEPSIPFGMMFLVFGAIGTIALVLIVKKRRTLVK